MIVLDSGPWHGRRNEEDRTPMDAKTAQTKVNGLRSKLPAKAPQYLQADYKTFIGLADGFTNDLDTLVKSEDGTKSSRDDYPGKKAALADLKKKINDAVKVQQSKVSELLKEIAPLNKSAGKLLDVLKDKKGKDETDLSSAIFKFTAALQSITGLEAPDAVD
jgi:hypothetical protein